MTTKPPTPRFFLDVPITPPDPPTLKPPAPRGPVPGDTVDARERARRKLTDHPEAESWVREIWERVARGERA